MNDLSNALPTGGPVKCAQKRGIEGESMGKYRLLLVLTLGFCLLLVDGFLWHGPCAGLPAAVFAWYALILAWMGPKAFASRSSRVLLAAILFLAATMALGSDPYFRCWDLLALLVLIPVHAMAGLASRPWWDPRWLGERFRLLFRGLFGDLWACFAAAVPDRRDGGRPRRTLAVVLGLCGAAALGTILLAAPGRPIPAAGPGGCSGRWCSRPSFSASCTPWPPRSCCARRRGRRASGWMRWASCWCWRQWMGCTWRSWRCSPPGCSAGRSTWRPGG